MCNKVVYDPNLLSNMDDLLGDVRTYVHFGVSVGLCGFKIFEKRKLLRSSDFLMLP